MNMVNVLICIDCIEFMFHTVSPIFLATFLRFERFHFAVWDDDSSHTLTARPAAGASWQNSITLDCDRKLMAEAQY